MVKYLKLTFDDLDGIQDDELYKKMQLDEDYYKTIILNEVRHLESQGVKIVLHDIENDFIVVEYIDNIEQLLKYFSIVSITYCDNLGNNLGNNQENSQDVKNAKYNIIVEYLKTQGVKNFNPVLSKNYIRFSCPICNKINLKMCISIHGFKIITFSESDCTNDKHQEAFTKWTKAIKKLWDESKEKKYLIYNLNMKYIKKIIESTFPHIVRHKSTGLLFKYDDNLNHYVEMVDNELISDIETLIYNNFFNDNNESLKISQMRDLKKVILKSYPFKDIEFEKSSLFNLKNGVYDFKLKQIYQHSKDYYFNYCSSINYNPAAKTDVLNNFLKAVITEDNPVHIIKAMLGHIHYDGAKLQKGFIFEGTKHGRNGKGTVVDLIQETLGENRTKECSLDSFFTSDFMKYELKDKILYIEDDFKKDFIKEAEIGFLNKLISGANEQVHQKNKPSINITLKAIPIIQSNKRIRLKASDDGGFYKRWVVVNFKNEYGDAKIMDEFLGEKLLSNDDVMSSMFNYLIEGYQMVIERRNNNMKGSFFKDDEVSHVEDWRRENNSVISFFDDCVDLNPMCLCSTRELYDYYNRHWNLNSPKLSEKNFILQVKEEMNLKHRRVWLDGKTKQVMCFEGCCFIPEYDVNTYKYNKIINKNCNKK